MLRANDAWRGLAGLAGNYDPTLRSIAVVADNDIRIGQSAGSEIGSAGARRGGNSGHRAASRTGASLGAIASAAASATATIGWQTFG